MSIYQWHFLHNDHVNEDCKFQFQKTFTILVTDIEIFYKIF